MSYCHDLVSVEALRARIAALEGTWQHATASDIGRREGALPAALFGLPPIDRALPGGGLPTACLHELTAAAPADGSAAGFAAALLALLGEAEGARPRSVLWCAAGNGLYGPGLAGYGLDTRRLVLVRGRSQADLLWAMEESLRSGAVAAVLGEVQDADLTATRRLQLAAEAGRSTALLLRTSQQKPGESKPAPSAAVTAWRIAAAPSAPAPYGIGVGAERWRVELVRCRGGVPRQWLLEWNDEAHRLVMASELRDRPAHAPAGVPSAKERTSPLPFPLRHAERLAV
jgi:protein ImuA